MSRTHATSIKDLAQRCGISRVTLYKHMQSPGFPAKEKNGWAVDRVMAFVVKAAQARGGAAAGGEPRTLKDMKLIAEIALLKAKLERIRAEWLPITDVKTFLGRYAGIINSTFDFWVENAAAIRNAGLLRKAEDLRDKCRQRLADEAERLDDMRAAAASKIVEAHDEGV